MLVVVLFSQVAAQALRDASFLSFLIHTHTHTHIHIPSYIHTYFPSYIYIHSLVHTYTFLHIHTPLTHIHIHSLIYTHLHTPHIHSLIHTHTHSFIHTHTHSLISSVQFGRSVVSDSLRPHESQHARPSCPAPTPRVHPDSRPSSQ